jgi:hypothetical protein
MGGLYGTKQFGKFGQVEYTEGSSVILDTTPEES